MDEPQVTPEQLEAFREEAATYYDNADDRASYIVNKLRFMHLSWDELFKLMMDNAIKTTRQALQPNEVSIEEEPETISVVTGLSMSTEGNIIVESQKIGLIAPETFDEFDQRINNLERALFLTQRLLEMQIRGVPDHVPSSYAELEELEKDEQLLRCHLGNRLGVPASQSREQLTTLVKLGVMTSNEAGAMIRHIKDKLSELSPL